MLHLSWRNTYKCNYSSSVFPHMESSASRSFLLALPLSPIWSIHCFKLTYGEISSYTLSHFCLTVTSYVEGEHL